MLTPEIREQLSQQHNWEAIIKALESRITAWISVVIEDWWKYARIDKERDNFLRSNK